MLLRVLYSKIDKLFFVDLIVNGVDFVVALPPRKEASCRREVLSTEASSLNLWLETHSKSFLEI